jgi:ABC-type proline/glycine betaine transport system permease subunit
VGIQERKGKLNDENLDNRIFVPLPIVTRVLLGGRNVVHLDVRVESESEIDAAQEEIETLLRHQHELSAGYPNDFTTEDQASILKDPWKVQAQFLIEAAILSILGGLAGVLAGIGVTHLIGALASWDTLVRAPSLVIAFVVAVVVGLFFGYYPARRAARLDPITALRYE